MMQSPRTLPGLSPSKRHIYSNNPIDVRNVEEQNINQRLSSLTIARK